MLDVSQEVLANSTLIRWSERHNYAPLTFVSDQPWARVFGARDGQGNSLMLKEILPPSRSKMGTWMAMSEAFPGLVPELMAAHETGRFFAMEDVLAGQADEPAKPIDSHELLEIYGGIQAKAALDQRLLNALPSCQAEQVLAQVLELLSDTSDSWPGNSFHYLPQRKRNGISAFLTKNEGNLKQIFACLENVSPTVNHTDLRRANSLRRSDGRICILDWDDAAIAAPGVSLHMQFSGLQRLFATLYRPQAYINEGHRKADAKALRHYIGALCSSGVFAPEEVKPILPVAAMLGVFKYIADLAPYGIPELETRENIARMVNSRLKDIETCLPALSALVSKKPKNTQGVAVVSKVTKTAEPTSLLPEVDLKSDADTHEATALFSENGAVLLKSVFSGEIIANAYRTLIDGKPQIMADITSGRALKVGDRRFMLSTGTDGVFGSPQLLAEPRLLSVLDHLLGPEFILGSLTTVLSLHASKAQNWHRDNSMLFAEEAVPHLPAFSIAVIVPLVPLDATIGATEIRLKSHFGAKSADSDGLTAVPQVSLGDCYLMDSRVLHRGMANNSDIARPILSLVYQRPWYRDYQNFNQQSSLQMSTDTVAKFPTQRQQLVSWAVTP